MTTISVIERDPQSSVQQQAGTLLRARLNELSRATTQDSQERPFRVELDTDPGIGAGGFSIADLKDQPGVQIAAPDLSGLVAGIGKFLHDANIHEGGPVPGRWRGVSVPVNPVRGIYFATHFFNYYHVAPLAEVERYIEDLAMWGCNALAIWFDMHHYRGMDDPDAQAMVARLNNLLAAAERVGMAPTLFILANEAFDNSPPAMRADWTSGHDGYIHDLCGHYHVELCPNKPGAMQQLLRWRREVWSCFQNVAIKYIGFGPYDQGGCTCSACAPWGANGYLTCSRELTNLAHEMFPASKIVLSTWRLDCFTKGELAGLRNYFKEDKHGIDYIMVETATQLADGIPGKLPLLTFPEISMGGMTPWGGFGANPRPEHWELCWKNNRGLIAGSFPYSEGIYEDINKVIHLQLNWEPGQSIRQILAEYAAAHFGNAVAADAVEACFRLERAMWYDTNIAIKQADRAYNIFSFGGRIDASKPWSLHYSGGKMEQREETLRLLEAVDQRLQPAARRAWRWRQIMLRGQIDHEILLSGGHPSPALDNAFNKLAELYYCNTAQTDPCLTPPSFTYIKWAVENVNTHWT